MSLLPPVGINWKQVATIIAALASIGAVHSFWVVPQVSKEVAKDMQAIVDRHEGAGSHPNSVTRYEFTLVYDKLSKIEERLDRVIERR